MKITFFLSGVLMLQSSTKRSAEVRRDTNPSPLKRPNTNNGVLTEPSCGLPFPPPLPPRYIGSLLNVAGFYGFLVVSYK